MLEERNKKRDDEDLKATLASIMVDRRGKVTKIKEIDFTSTSTDASTEVTPTVSNSSSGVTLDQVKKLLALRDVHWVNSLSSKEREAAGKKPEIGNDSLPISTVAASEVYTPQPSAALPMSPQYGMPMGYISSQTVTPTNVMGAQYTYSDTIVSISS